MIKTTVIKYTCPTNLSSIKYTSIYRVNLSSLHLQIRHVYIVYLYSYQSADGSQRQETGTLKYPAVPGYPPVLSVQGAYAAITPEGEPRRFYTAPILLRSIRDFIFRYEYNSNFFTPIYVFSSSFNNYRA